MGKKKRLSKKQLGVIDDLLSGQFDEQLALEKHGVSRGTLSRWLAEDAFGEELEGRIKWLNRQAKLIIARYAPLAATKLVQLTDSEKEETARKACLDIISLPVAGSSNEQSTEPERGGEEKAGQLSADMCSRLLASLAEAEEQQAKND